MQLLFVTFVRFIFAHFTSNSCLNVGKQRVGLIKKVSNAIVIQMLNISSLHAAMNNIFPEGILFILHLFCDQDQIHTLLHF
jgi:hypothetical protein